MTTVSAILERTRALGLRLEPRPGFMLAVIPKGKLPPDLAAEIRLHKTEIMSILIQAHRGWGTVPPGDLPLDPVMPRPTTANREAVIAYLLRQGCDRPGPLTRWLVRRETAYYEGPGRTWDCALHAYAVARDTACWQLDRGEREVIDLINGCDAAATWARRTDAP